MGTFRTRKQKLIPPGIDSFGKYVAKMNKSKSVISFERPLDSVQFLRNSLTNSLTLPVMNCNIIPEIQ